MKLMNVRKLSVVYKVLCYQSAGECTYNSFVVGRIVGFLTACTSILCGSTYIHDLPGRLACQIDDLYHVHFSSSSTCMRYDMWCHEEYLSSHSSITSYMVSPDPIT